ncbi:hypothetical protein [Nostoc mirabile]|uniref:hypothetical protein n=1 Tax=Nostoc mirabile TaxID=2907820 RepID=UPI001E5E5797|nr:hypothetical protein [Nostoc mirabile]
MKELLLVLVDGEDFMFVEILAPNTQWLTARADIPTTSPICVGLRNASSAVLVEAIAVFKSSAAGLSAGLTLVAALTANWAVRDFSNPANSPNIIANCAASWDGANVCGGSCCFTGSTWVESITFIKVLLAQMRNSTETHRSCRNNSPFNIKPQRGKLPQYGTEKLTSLSSDESGNVLHNCPFWSNIANDSKEFPEQVAGVLGCKAFSGEAEGRAGQSGDDILVFLSLRIFV